VRPRLLTGLGRLSSLLGGRRCRDRLLSRLRGLHGLRDRRGLLVALAVLVGHRPSPTARCDLEVVVLVLSSLRSERIRSSTADVTVQGRAALGGVQCLLLGPEVIEGSRGAITGRDGWRLALERLDRRHLGHRRPTVLRRQRLEVLEQLLSLDARQLGATCSGWSCTPSSPKRGPSDRFANGLLRPTTLKLRSFTSPAFVSRSDVVTSPSVTASSVSLKVRIRSLRSRPARDPA